VRDDIELDRGNDERVREERREWELEWRERI
jgi:hypothetical protein